jgi:hypothetical protein
MKSTPRICDLGALVDLEPDVDLGLVDRLDLPLDRGQVVALLVVQLRDLVAVLLDLGDVEDRVAIEVDDLVDLVEPEVAGAVDQDLADRRLLLDREGQDRAAARGQLGLDDHVGEVAHLPHRPDVVADLGGVDRVPTFDTRLTGSRRPRPCGCRGTGCDRSVGRSAAARPRAGASGPGWASAGAATAAIASAATAARRAIAPRPHAAHLVVGGQLAAVDHLERTRHHPRQLEVVGHDQQRRAALAVSSTNSWWISSPVWRSRLPVGSSARSSAGSSTIARARATRCCSPPDSSDGLWVRRATGRRDRGCRRRAGAPGASAVAGSGPAS